MKSKVLLMLFFVFTNLQLFSQDEIKRLNFILLIDSKIPISNISDSFFIIQDSVGKVMEKVPFNYKVGWLEFNKSDFEKISFFSNKYSLLMRFKFTASNIQFSQHFYQSTIWLSKDYMIMNIYNKSKRENFEKFEFGKEDYIVHIETSYFNSIPHYRTEWLQRHRSEIN